ncbi:MAG TPA: hypothetical protein VJ917_08210 [Saprospiraceae bacterium]|nr:hypothetical protein [Saprospiraceae bacterium]
MIRVSSNSTMFLRFFVPIVWIVFFGAISLAMVFHRGFQNAMAEIHTALVPGLIVLYLLTVGALALTIMRLKRIECDELFLYASNYFKTARYPYHQIKDIREQSFFGVPLVDVELKKKGVFGRRLFFIGRQATLNQLYNKHADLGQ